MIYVKRYVRLLMSSKVILFTYVVSDMTCSALRFFEEQSTHICLVYDLDTIQLGMLEASVHIVSCLNIYNPIHGLSPRRLLSPHAPAQHPHARLHHHRIGTRLSNCELSRNPGRNRASDCTVCRSDHQSSTSCIAPTACS